MLFDFFALYYCEDDVFRHWIKVRQPGALMEALDEKRGIVIVMAHFGNWEAVCEWFSRNGFRFAALAQRLMNPQADAIVRRARRQHGMRLYSIHTPNQELLRFLGDAGILAIVADQDAKQRGVWVDFMGVPSSTHRSPATYALRKRCPLLLATCYRDRSGRYLIHFERIPVNAIISGQSDPIYEVTQAYTHLIEHHIRQRPEQYFWFHRRWKTRTRS